MNRAEFAGCADSAEFFDVLEVGPNTAQISKRDTHLLFLRMLDQFVSLQFALTR
jgi:hypothetical protein